MDPIDPVDKRPLKRGEIDSHATLAAKSESEIGIFFEFFRISQNG